jgi:hypothetical protein
MNGVNKQRLEQAVKAMQDLPGDGTAEGICGNVANGREVQAIADSALEAKAEGQRAGVLARNLAVPAVDGGDFPRRLRQRSGFLST